MAAAIPLVAKFAVPLLIGGIAGGAATKLLSPKKQEVPQQVAAAPEAPAVMPTPDDATIQQARKRSIIAQMGRRGRASTILTGGSDTLGG